MISISDIFNTTIPINIVKYKLKVQRVFFASYINICLKRCKIKEVDSWMATPEVNFLEKNLIKFFYEGMCYWNGIWDLVRNKCRNWFVVNIYPLFVQLCWTLYIWLGRAESGGLRRREVRHMASSGQFQIFSSQTN